MQDHIGKAEMFCPASFPERCSSPLLALDHPLPGDLGHSTYKGSDWDPDKDEEEVLFYGTKSNMSHHMLICWSPKKD